MMRRLVTVTLPVVLLAATGPAAVAAWTSEGGADGSVTATGVNAGNLPVPTRVVTSDADGSVGLSWSASTLASGDPVTHYDVLRSDGTTSTTVCAGEVATACTDPAPVPGPVTYAVVPSIGTHWRGPASAATEFQFDVYAPVTTVERTPMANQSGWDNDTVRIALTASDPGPVASGVKEIHYTINGGAPVVVTGAVAEFDVSEENQYDIVFWAVDHLGNTESPGGSQDVNIDRTAPVSSGQLDGDQAHLSATDSGGSGVDRVEYRIGSSGAYSTYAAPVTLADGQTIYFRALDRAGNLETPDKSLTHTAPVTDVTPPVTSVASSPTPNPAGWTTADTTLTLASTDDVAVDRLEWRFGPSGTVSTISGTGPFTIGPLTTEGTTDVQYRAFDVAGNAEDWTGYDVKIDRTDPVAAISHPAAKINNAKQFNDKCRNSSNQQASGWCGTYGDAISGVQGIGSVKYVLKRISETATQCWTGTGWDAGGCGAQRDSIEGPTTGSTWFVPIAFDALGVGNDVSFEMNVIVTDRAGRTVTVTRTSD